MNAVYCVVGVKSERIRVVAVVVAAFYEGCVGASCEDRGHRALAVCWFSCGDSEQDSESIFLDEVGVPKSVFR